MGKLQSVLGWYADLPRRNKIGLWAIVGTSVFCTIALSLPPRRPSCKEAMGQLEHVKTRSPSTSQFADFAKANLAVVEVCFQTK
jgi:hypothetical protein